MKNQKRRVYKQSSWYVINIKSRGIQSPKTYIEALESLSNSDPLVHLRASRYISLKSLGKSQFLESDGTVKVIYINLTSYDILNPEEFYNRRKKESVSLILDPDIVANFKEVEILFIPKIHRMAFRKNSKIALNHIERYFQKALNEVAGEGLFDVDIVKSHDTIKRILSACKIYSVEADISFSNRDPSGGFKSLFDDKVNELNPDRLNIKMKGSKERPLQNVDDGLLEAIVEISESNGSVKAVVKEKESSKNTTINTAKYPALLTIDHTSQDLNTIVYNEMVSKYSNQTAKSKG